MNWVDALKTVGPLVIGALARSQPYIPLILKGIEIAEAIGNDEPDRKSDKKDIAVKMTGLATETANVVTKSNAFDPEEAMDIAQRSIDMVIQATNELHRKSNKL